MMASGRLGLLGGTFDPPHIGHLIVAQDALEALQLERLIVVPAGIPPHRAAVLDPRVRFRLVVEAFRGDDSIEVADVELIRDGPSWTVDTVEWVRRELDPVDLILIVGADQYRAFHSWREPGRITEMARLAVMTRSGDDVRDTGVPFERIDVTRVDISSTRIRERLADGRSIRYLVPESIRESIETAWADRAKQLA
jgi:nicotinate-nucleotide adenylyltransferase